MGLNPGSRAMIAAMRAAHPETGLKKLTTEVNELLPASMRVEKHELRDFVRSLADESSDRPNTATKTRDESFQANTANKVFSLLREAEREYLINLDNSEVTGMHHPNNDKGRCHPVSHLRHHLQVFLVLMGFRPCVPFVSPKDTGIATMGEMVLRCLVPLMEQFDLESYGFKLLYVATDVLLWDHRFRGFKGSWVLADTRSTGWRAVRQMFVAMPKPRIPATLMCAVLGYPVTPKGFNNQVDLLDATEHAVLRDSFDQDTCTVNVLKIYCDEGDEGDWDSIAEYFMACRDAVAQAGTVLGLEMEEHPMMEEWCRATGKLAGAADAAEA